MGRILRSLDGLNSGYIREQIDVKMNQNLTYNINHRNVISALSRDGPSYAV